MNQKKMTEIQSLLDSNNIEDSKRILQNLMDGLFLIAIEHHRDTENFYEEKYAKIIAQMVFVKLYDIRRQLEGVSYQCSSLSFKEPIIDSNEVASKTRGLFELICIFNSIFISTRGKEEVILKLLIWEASSLKYRQKLKNGSVENVEQEKLLMKDEKRLKEIEDLIRHNEVYANLQIEEKKKLEKIIQKKEFKFVIRDGKVKMRDWQTLANELIYTNNVNPFLYTLLSFYSHPSWKSVMDFGNGFNNKKDWIENTQLFLVQVYALSSVFITDFVSLFPKTRKTYEIFPDTTKFIIEFYNGLLRDEKYKHYRT